MVTLALSVLKKPQISPNIWKFNNDLKNDRFNQQMLALIEEIDILQVHLQKLEYDEKVFFFLVTYFKKRNFHIF